MVTKMQRLEAEVMMYAGRDRSQLSDLEYAAVILVARSDALRRRRERRRERKKQRKKKLPRAPRPRCRRPCVHQRQVPAVRSPVVTQRQVPTVHSFMLPVQFLDTVFDIPVVVLRQMPGLMVHKTVDRPQLQSIHGCRHSLSFRCGSPSWSRLFQQTTEIPQLLFHGRCPRYVGVQSLRCCRGEDLCAPTVAARTLSTTPCIWQSLVRCSPVEYAVFSTSWFTSGYMTTSVYVVVLLAGCMHLALCSLACRLSSPTTVVVHGWFYW